MLIDAEALAAGGTAFAAGGAAAEARSTAGLGFGVDEGVAGAAFEPAVVKGDGGFGDSAMDDAGDAAVLAGNVVGGVDTTAGATDGAACGADAGDGATDGASRPRNKYVAGTAASNRTPAASAA